jgi:rare lipoprotein A
MIRRQYWLLVLALMLAACQSAPTPVPGPATSAPSAPRPVVPRADGRDGAPDYVPADLEFLPDPVPRNEVKSSRGNPATYSVFGKTYRVLDTAIGYYATGLASWYGTKFHGRLTSSGEPYDLYQLTAAHRSLPIPTYVRVTNLENGRSTVVRVNDRGPFHNDRIIDLSFAAAVKLGFANVGTARVRIDSLETAGPLVAPAVVADNLPYVLQAGAFVDVAAANALKDRLSQLTGQPGFVVQPSTDALYRVRIGPVTGRPEALRLRALIVASNFDEPLILRQ